MISMIEGINAKKLTKTNYDFEFSICTLVTRKEEYHEMLKSFEDSGFNEGLCEYIFADNIAGNQYDAYEATNLFLRQASGKYIIICHQDVLINKDNIIDLRNHLANLDKKDLNWAICSNAGANGPNYVVYHISYPLDGLQSKGHLPIKVSSVDENFIVIKNSALLKVSNNLSGYHLYGTDLCLQAELNGFSSYVIPFNLTHKSKGDVNKEFYRLRKEIIIKYDNFFKGRWIQTNISTFYLSGSFLKFFLDNPIILFFVRIGNGIKKRLK